MDKYKELFYNETEEHLELINNSLLELEQDPEDGELIDQLFRSFHTIKGMAGTMGYDKIVEISHKLENILAEIRQGEKKVSPGLIDIIFKGVDTLELLIAGEEVGISDLLQQIDAAGSSGGGERPLARPLSITLQEREEKALEQAEELGKVVRDIKVTLEDDCVFRTLRADMVINKLLELGEIVVTIPRGELQDEALRNGFRLLLVTQAEEERLEAAINSISEIKAIDITEFNLADFLSAAEESDQEVVEAPQGRDERPAEEDKEEDDGNRSISTIKQQLTRTNSIRVDIKRLDNLMNLVAEMVIKRSQVESVGLKHNLKELNKELKSLGKVTNAIQNEVMQMRMVPIGQVFKRFPRLVRDLSKELGKEVDLVIEGEGTELDRTIVNEIGDPLVHLIRNAIDHGIEDKGKVKLVAYHEGNNVVIEVFNTGRPLNPGQIKEKAVEKGLISEAAAGNLSNQEAIKLIFIPGFSTSSEVSDISGRGVGMDVVKNTIESLNGSIDVKSGKGGTSFILKLPLTLAIIQGFMVEISQQKYVLPLKMVREIVKVGRDELVNIEKGQVIRLREDVIPLVDLRGVLKGVGEWGEEKLPVVIVESGEDLFGLVVEKVSGQQEVVIKHIDEEADQNHFLAGATILGDGKVALILDVDKIINNGGGVTLDG
ncbi:MAG: chemotaxis protein CheA [Halanaerobium sp.]|nr:chemotaxis protein CheA [Halanaerobium sp.]